MVAKLGADSHPCLGGLPVAGASPGLEQTRAIGEEGALGQVLQD